jgi:hypothetical protein
VYRLKDGRYQARALSGDAESNEWSLRDYWVTLGFRKSDGGWYEVEGLPWAAKAIDSPEAQDNPGYAQAAMRQCYTCKQVKPEDEFELPWRGEHDTRNWECNACYIQRMRELGRFRKSGAKREGDFLERGTLASPPPPEGEI